MRRLIWVFLGLWLWPQPAAAECGGRDLVAELRATDPAAHAELFAEAHRVANARGKFWRVSRAGVPDSWLFGTFHDTGIAREPLDPEVAAVLGSARLMLVEVTRDEQARMQARIQSDPDFVFTSDGNGLIGRLSAAERAAAARALAGRGLSLEVAGQMRRWLLFSALSVPLCLQEEMRAGLPMLDNLLMARAEKAAVPVAGLESYLQVPAALAAVPRPVMDEILLESLRDIGGEEDALRTSAALYRAGETAAIWEFSVREAAESVGLVRASNLLGTLAENLIDARNRAWMKVLEPELARGGVFAAFGALHLPGQAGVIELLRARGFEVTRLDR